MVFQSNIIEELTGSQAYHQRSEPYGERAWKILGENVDVVYWDVGNGWSSIISIIPHDGREVHAQEFWHRLLQSNDD